jgi:lipoate-protein ligase A
MSGAENMALDHALLWRARTTGEAVVRVYEWRQPTLSFGRHQPARGAYNDLRAAEMGIAFVRRPTGGRAVLHWREITYSVTAPLRGRVGESYAATNRLLVSALRRLGVAAELAAGSKPAPLRLNSPCFDRAVEGEVVCDGRKLVGSAQWRERAATMQHGSILIDDDQWMLSEIASWPDPASECPVTLRELLGRAPIAGEIASALRAALDDAAEPLVLDSDTCSAAAQLRAHYEEDAWTWRL